MSSSCSTSNMVANQSSILKAPQDKNDWYLTSKTHFWKDAKKLGIEQALNGTLSKLPTAPTAGISEQDRFKNQLALLTLQNAQKQTKDKAWAFLHDFVSDTPLAPLIRKHEDKFNVVDFTKDILQHYEKGTSADEFTQYTKFKDTLEKLVPMDSDDPVTDLKNVCILIDNIDAAIQKLPSNNSALSDFDKLLYLRKALLRDPSNRFSQYNTKKQFYSSFQLELIELVSAQLLKDNLAKPPSAAVSKMSSSINETNEAANLTSQDSEANAAQIKSLKSRIFDIKRNSASNDHLNVNGKRVFYDNRDNFCNRGRGQNSRGQTYHQYNNRNNNNFSLKITLLLFVHLKILSSIQN